MKVTRTRFSNGISSDDISCEYHNVELNHNNNNNLPGHIFFLTFGKWPEGSQEPLPGYQRLVMYGAEIQITYKGLILHGFVSDESSLSRRPKDVKFTLERWYYSY